MNTSSIYSRVLTLFGILSLATSAYADLTLRVSVNALIGPFTYYLDLQSNYESGPGSTVRLDNFEVKPGKGFQPTTIVHGLTGPATLTGAGVAGNLTDGLTFMSTLLTPTNEYYQLMDNSSWAFGLDFDLTLVSPFVGPGQTIFSIALLDKDYHKIHTLNAADSNELAQFSISGDAVSILSNGIYIDGPFGANVVATPVVSAVPEPASFPAFFCGVAVALAVFKLRKNKV